MSMEIPASRDAAWAEAQTTASDFQRLFEAAPGLYLVLDPALRVVAASDHYLRATHLPRETLLGSHLFDVFLRSDTKLAEADSRALAAIPEPPDSRALAAMTTLPSGPIPPGAYEVHYWLPEQSLERLPTGQVSYIVLRIEDVSEFFASIASLQRVYAMEYLAHHDALTGLPNRLLLLAQLTHAIDQAGRSGCKGAVLFFDLDRFKPVNDCLGHAAGDELLQRVALRLRERLRGVDTVARLGGDEFVVVLEGLADADEAANVARALVARLAEPYWLEGGHEVHIGTTIGISLFPDDGEGPAELIQHADTALYQAKEAGRGTFRFYSETMTQEANARLDLETRLQYALAHNEFTLYFQPLVALSERRLLGVEALVRWQRPGRGLLGPSEFLALAEDSGLIVPLGDWVLREACRCLRRWQAEGMPIERLAVNLSPRQFQQPDVVERVAAALADTGVPAAALALDIAESALVQQDRDIDTLAQLRALGVSLAIDDFGGGLSLAYLNRLPIHQLKMAQSIVQEQVTGGADHEVSAAVIAVAKALNLEALAKGVETEDQIDFLCHQGCTAGQGHWFSPPLTVPELGAWWRAGAPPARAGAGMG